MMALDSAFLLPSHQSLLDWDQLSSFGLPDFHDFMSSGMESPSCSDASIGYLQDTVTCSKRESSKRRKKELSSLNEPNMADYEDLHYLFEDFWNSSPIYPPSTLNSITPENTVASDDRIPSVLLESPSLPPQMTPDYNAELNSTESHDLSTGSKPSCSSFTRNIFILSPKGHKKKRPTTTSVVYPFVAVKPAGLEGNVTLEDINQRLLMRPARPVPHPVGEFACAPTMSIGEPGLSGKSVVSLLRIQTRGAGSITIIRTKG